ncbi:MAG: amidohydrolase family protein [Duodenibacillus sp.]|nr:amidohydrolase family protein [Duodenibacillus sp.]
MIDLLIRNGRVVDPANGVDGVMDVAVEDGKVAAVGEELALAARETLDATGKIVVPGIIDMHTHMRTVEGHPHAQRMLALAGVCTTLDMAGPLDNIVETIPSSGAGVSIAIVEAARAGVTLASARPGAAEREALIERTLERGGIGVKLLGGHFPMDLDVCADFIADAARHGAWVAWHAGSSAHGSDIEGMRDAVACSEGRFLHVAHVNSYCRGQVSNPHDEAMEAIEMLNASPHIFSESYLSDLNGTRFTIKDGAPMSKVTCTCLRKVGCEPTEAGMEKAILLGRAGVLQDTGVIGRLVSGKEGVEVWRAAGTAVAGSFSVNPALSRYLVAQARRPGGAFTVDCFSTDGGCYPRNVIVENGLLLVQFGTITMAEFVVKASLNGARALGLPEKGHLGAGADADVSVLDYERKKAWATVAGGKVIMKAGELLGSGTTIICDARGEAWLKARGVACRVKGPLEPEKIAERWIP